MQSIYTIARIHKAFTKSLLFLAFLIYTPSIMAEDGSPHSVSANVTLTSDYVYRGITQTNEDPAIQGGFDYSHESGFYLGVWASNLEFNVGTDDAASIEVDVYGGLSGTFQNGMGWDVGALYYFYPNQDEDGGADYDFLELYGSLSYEWDTEYSPAADIGVAYSADFYGEDDTGVWIHGSVGMSIPGMMDPYIKLGHQDVKGGRTTPEGFDYFYYAVGVSKTVDILTFDLSYQDADLCASNDDDTCEAVVFSVSSSW